MISIKVQVGIFVLFEYLAFNGFFVQGSARCQTDFAGMKYLKICYLVIPGADMHIRYFIFQLESQLLSIDKHTLCSGWFSAISVHSYGIEKIALVDWL